MSFLLLLLLLQKKNLKKQFFFPLCSPAVHIEPNPLKLMVRMNHRRKTTLKAPLLKQITLYRTENRENIMFSKRLNFPLCFQIISPEHIQTVRNNSAFFLAEGHK